MKVEAMDMNEAKLIDLMGNIDLGMLVDKIVEKDMKASTKFFKTKLGKILLILFPAILLLFIVIFVCLAIRKKD